MICLNMVPVFMASAHTHLGLGYRLGTDVPSTQQMMIGIDYLSVVDVIWERNSYHGMSWQMLLCNTLTFNEICKCIAIMLACEGIRRCNFLLK